MATQQDDKTLNLFPIDYPFETLISRITAAEPKLILDPDFQRKFKWDKDGWKRSSKFIESCLMRIPLPSCYFAENDNQTHLVIDGVQRLTTIVKFFNNEFALDGMTMFKELEGKKFSEIGDYRGELEATTIRCIVLRKENSKSLIREIFSRLNQGAVKLSDQEIRHALYPGELDRLLTKLSQIPAIKNFGLGTTSTRKKDSLEAEEQVLRFFAFQEGFEKYSGDFTQQLDNYMEKSCNISKKKSTEMEKVFLSCLKNCQFVFENSVFTNGNSPHEREGLVYYDLLMHTVGPLEKQTLQHSKDRISDAFKELCNSNEFKKTLSGGLQKKSSVVKRRKLWDNLLEKATNE